MGRPPMLTGVNITVPRPLEEATIESNSRWQPYVDDPGTGRQVGFLWTYYDPVSLTSKHTVSFAGYKRLRAIIKIISRLRYAKQWRRSDRHCTILTELYLIVPSLIRSQIFTRSTLKHRVGATNS
jgi:hypothetical protein